ncbi:MAG: hypothetical protein ACD_79C00739G0023 [uncultured bacterium]|nr:MAG: hypothetical protein ACD_79C00739G0023 [uncultured bacterium]
MYYLYAVLFLILILVLFKLWHNLKPKPITPKKDSKIITSPPKDPALELKKKYEDLLNKMISSLTYNYKDIKIVAEGGMGIIAEAFDKERQRKVAIKTILPELKDNNNIVAMFLQECQVIQGMNHPNIVRIFEVGRSDFLYYVMDFLDGKPLQDIIDAEKKLSVAYTVKIGCQVARALQHIHSNGLIHRDIKPSNLYIVENNLVKIIDFGIAKLLNAGSSIVHCTNAGSPIYSSPEQLQGGEISGKSDIYSFGVCLFYMLSGEHPFNSEDVLSKMFESPKKLKNLVPDIPEALSRMVDLCLHVDPKKRLAAHELWARLRAL